MEELFTFSVLRAFILTYLRREDKNNIVLDVFRNIYLSKVKTFLLLTNTFKKSDLLFEVINAYGDPRKFHILYGPPGKKPQVQTLQADDVYPFLRALKKKDSTTAYYLLQQCRECDRSFFDDIWL